MVLLGFLVTLGAGVALGLLGGGGSLLIVPALVYLFHVPPAEATAYSLVTVAAVSAAGAWLHVRRRAIPFRRLALFALPSVVAAYAVRAWVAPNVPDFVIMVLFAGFAGAAGIAMLRPGAPHRAAPVPTLVIPLVGGATGALTALAGAGGGFLVLPALVVLVGISVEQAVGASLAVVAGQATAGTLGALGAMPAFDVRLTFALTTAMLLGLAWGMAAGERVAPASLRRGFGWLVLAVAAAIVARELA